ncbi:hypothetical protein [Paenibacillus daejeonensis]|uniref:hypothetical protein n=1 Tax=Paenibacillus daejeonensis TaxID=135193 RepID=UPI00036B5C24|nr:hypothetical protein [Paenibacillus daejeonensis]
MIKLALKIFLLSILLTACSSGSSSYELIALDIIKKDSNEDIFMIEDRVYKIDENKEKYLFENHELKSVAEILEVYNGGNQFNSGMATKLPGGT